MTPEEIYNGPFIFEPNEGQRHYIEWLVGTYYTHVPEVTEESGYGRCLPSFDPLGFTTVRQHCVLYEDTKREWVIRSVWFREAPVMVCVNAGRDGDDHHNRWVTDIDYYKQMCAHLRSILRVPGHPKNPTVEVPQDKDQHGITKFYHRDLEPHIGTWTRDR